MSALRCATSRRCRQPLAFMVVRGNWPAVVCAKHLGVLAQRMLAVSDDGGPAGTDDADLVVKLIPEGVRLR